MEKIMRPEAKSEALLASLGDRDSRKSATGLSRLLMTTECSLQEVYGDRVPTRSSGRVGKGTDPSPMST